MPPASPPCAIPGCPDDARPGRARCTRHDQDARTRADRHRPTAAARGYDRKWRRTSDRHLAANPHCTCTGCPSCLRVTDAGRCLRPSTDSDHLDGLGPHGPRGHDLDNLQALCHECHAHRTARDQGWMAT